MNFLRALRFSLSSAEMGFAVGLFSFGVILSSCIIAPGVSRIDQLRKGFFLVTNGE